MARIDRLHFLMSIFNYDALRKIEIAEGVNDFETIPASRRIPKFLQRNSWFCKFWVGLFVLGLPFLKFPLFISSFFKSITTPKINFCGKSILLPASIALDRVSKNANVNSDYWLQVPWSEAMIAGNSKKLTVFDFLSCLEILESFVDSLRVIWYLYIKRGYRYPNYASNSYKLFMYDKAIRRIPLETELIFCNHKDIYSVFLDKLPHYNKTLIQHGTEIVLEEPSEEGQKYHIYNTKYKYWVQYVPYLFKTINKMYCFSEKEKEAMLVGVVSKMPEEIVITGYSLRDFNENLNGKPAILIIGYYSFYFDRETKLISLLQGKGVKVYLKNHPTLSPNLYRSLQEKYSFILLNGAVYPKVNVVFSYGSTLALEYENLGTKVILYDKLDIETLEHVVEDVIKKL